MTDSKTAGERLAGIEQTLEFIREAVGKWDQQCAAHRADCGALRKDESGRTTQKIERLTEHQASLSSWKARIAGAAAAVAIAFSASSAALGMAYTLHRLGVFEYANTRNYRPPHRHAARRADQLAPTKPRREATLPGRGI